MLLGLKAFAVRDERGEPYMPLLRRVHEGRPLWFVRFVDFAVPTLPDGSRVCDLHMCGRRPATRRATRSGSRRCCTAPNRVRVWAPGELERWLAAGGLVDVRVSGRLEDPRRRPTGEDVFASARTPQRGA